MSKPVKVLAMTDPPTMRELGQLLDSVLNGPGHEPRTEGFILMRFRHDVAGRPNYVASCDREHSIRMLKFLLVHLEGRITGEEGNA